MVCGCVVNTGAIRKSYKGPSAVDCAPNRHTGCTLKLQKYCVFHPYPPLFLLYYFVSFPRPEILEMALYKTSLFYWIITPPTHRADTGALCQDPPLEHRVLWPSHSCAARHQRSGGYSNNPCHTHAQALETLGCVWGEGSGLVVKGFVSFWSLEKFRKLHEKLQNLWTLQSVILKQASGSLYVSCCLVLGFPVQRDQTSKDPFHTIQYKTAKNCKISLNLRELYHLEKILEKNWLKSLSLYTDVFVEALNLCFVTAE